MPPACSYLPSKLLSKLFQVLKAKQRILQGSLPLMFRSLQQNPTLLYVTEGFTYTNEEMVVQTVFNVKSERTFFLWCILIFCSGDHNIFCDCL